jgi:hypothetical protein
MFDREVLVPTDTTERGLEDLICIAMSGRASYESLPESPLVSWTYPSGIMHVGKSR